MAEVREHIKSFLQLVTQELVYYSMIEDGKVVLPYEETVTYEEELILGMFLSDKDCDNSRDELRTLLEDRFLDFTGNFDQFVRECSSVYLNEDYFRTSFQDYAQSIGICSSHGYRKTLLVRACSLITDEDNTVNLNRSDKDGNTPLHLISFLPLHEDSDFNFFRALLKAGANPLATNAQGSNILHCIFGEKTRQDLSTYWMIYNLVQSNCFAVWLRMLWFLSTIIDEVHLDYLKITPDLDGDTVMHDYISWGCITGL